jgi:pantetheine-phosphate adenylyltransferase
MNLQNLLNKWKIKADISTLLGMWNESHRHYHNLSHLTSLTEAIDNISSNQNLSEKEYEKLLLTALFHDIIYDPAKSNNEEMSAEFFINLCGDKNNPDILDIKQSILDTKTHESSSKISAIFNKLDMAIVESDLNSLINWEKGIQDEFIPVYGKENYKEGRLKFLESLLDKYNHNATNLLELIKVVKDM